MAIGDKKPVVMQSDRAVPSGIATLGTDGKLLDAQIPGLDKLGAAPAGYGLGEPVGKILSTSDNLNFCKNNGWYNWADKPQNAPFDYAVMLVVTGNSSYTTQLIFSAYHQGNYMVRYTFDSGATWVEEWVNPPLLLGGLDGDGNDVNEYRTTERHNGKPVYVKVIECDALPDVGASNRKSVQYLASRPTQVVRYSGRLSYISIPNAIYGINVDVIGNQIYFETTADYYVGRSCTVTVYYTKD